MPKVPLLLVQILMGAAAGVTTALVKYISHDSAHILALIDQEQTSKIHLLVLGYVASAAVLLILGAVAVWYSAETNIRKMFAIGLSAPALLATGLGGEAPQKVALLLDQAVPAAHAQQSNAGCIGDGPFVKGAKLFFGWKDKVSGYQVVIGSYRDPVQAAAKASAVNDQNPGLDAKVGLRHCDNDFYPIVIGGAVPSLEEAKKLQAKAGSLEGVQDAFISPIPAQ